MSTVSLCQLEPRDPPAIKSTTPSNWLNWGPPIEIEWNGTSIYWKSSIAESFNPSNVIIVGGRVVITDIPFLVLTQEARSVLDAIPKEQTLFARQAAIFPPMREKGHRSPTTRFLRQRSQIVQKTGRRR
jgi:hypothetical protein